MPKVEEQTLHLLCELRSEMTELQAHFDGLEKQIDGTFVSLTEDLESLERAMIGKSVLARYRAANFEKRLNAIKKRLAVLEKGR